MLSILNSAFNHAVAGEVVCIPIPAPIASIFPLPFGLLLQKAVDGNHRISSSGSLLGATDISRFGKDFVRNYQMAGQPFEPVRENEATISSHLILKHPLEEPQVELIPVYILKHYVPLSDEIQRSKELLGNAMLFFDFFWQYPHCYSWNLLISLSAEVNGMIYERRSFMCLNRWSEK